MEYRHRHWGYGEVHRRRILRIRLRRGDRAGLYRHRFIIHRAFGRRHLLVGEFRNLLVVLYRRRFIIHLRYGRSHLFRLRHRL